MSKDIKYLIDKYTPVLHKYEERVRESFWNGGELEYKSAYNVAYSTLQSLYVKLIQEIVRDFDDIDFFREDVTLEEMLQALKTASELETRGFSKEQKDNFINSIVEGYENE